MGTHREDAAAKRFVEVWRPQPGPQTLLLQCPVEDVMFGGARGGGKSDALLGDFLKHEMLYGRAAQGMMVRRTMPQLEEIIARSKALFPRCGAEWRAGTKTWHFKSGARLKMRWLERPEDADEYQGHSSTYIGADESGTWPTPEGIDKLRATLRSPAGIPCVMRLTANPGGPGHQWIKERYVDPAPPLTPFYDQQRRVWRVFIPSRVQDNKRLLDADPGYIDRIRSSGPPWLVRAWLEGDWDASAGDEFFSRESLLVEGRGVEAPSHSDYVFAVIDTAVKTGSKNDSTAVAYFVFDRGQAVPLVVADWDIQQVEAALLERWLPGVFGRLEELSRACGARMGSVGCFIEDKASGTVLLQQAAHRGWSAHPIESALTALGKDERAMDVAHHIYRGRVKISQAAYDKVVALKGVSKNHFLSQVCGFRIGVKDQADDLLDCFTYSLALALGGQRGA